MSRPARRTLVATTAWDEVGEAQLVVRRVAGALASDGPVDVVALRSTRVGGWYEGAFAVHGLGPVPPAPRTWLRAASEAAGARGIPEAWSMPPEIPDDRWERLAAVVGDQRPDLLVLAGLRGARPLEAVARCGAGIVAVLPLLGDSRGGGADLQGRGIAAAAVASPLGPDDLRATLDVADTVLVTSPAERAGLALLGLTEQAVAAYDIGMWLGPTPMPADLSNHPPARAGARHPGVVVAELDPFPGADPWLCPIGEGHRGAGRLSGLSAAIGDRLVRSGVGAVTVVGARNATRLGVDPPAATRLLGRGQLDALVRSSLVVMDLQPGPLISRLALGAMVAGRSVVVASGTRGADLVGAGGGGASTGGLAEEVQSAAIEAMDAELAGHGHGVASQAAGVAWAQERWGDPTMFVDRVRAAVDPTKLRPPASARSRSRPW